MTLQEWIQIATSIISLIGIIFLIYHFFRNPDIKADKDISLLTSECDLKHKRLDEINFDTKSEIKEIKNCITLIKENHLHHLEMDVASIKLIQKEILTILQERNKK